MNYFRLFPDCLHQEGDKKGIIYCITTEKVVELNEVQNSIVKFLLNEGSIVEGELRFNLEMKKLIEKLIDEKVGTLFDTEVIVENFQPRCEWEMRGYLEEPPIINDFFITLGSKCEIGCKYCDGDYIFDNGCLTCAQWPLSNKNGDSSKTIETSKIVNEVMRFKPKEITISGGNPLDSIEELTSIVYQIRTIKKFQTIYLNVNLLHLKSDDLAKIKALDLLLRISISIKSRFDGNIVKKINETLDLLKHYCIKYKFYFISNAEETELNIDLINQIETEIKPIELKIVDIFKKGSSFKYKNKQKGREKIIINRDKFFANQKKNPCMKDKLSITNKGMIKVCPMLPINIGSLNENSIIDMFHSGKIDNLWKRTKQNLHECKMCEYKFFCNDCFALELGVEEQHLLEKVYCHYDISTGQWRG